MSMNYTVTFSPLAANNVAQVITTATISLLDGEVLWEEPVIVGVTEGMTLQDVEQAVQQAVSGFDKRVASILLAREFQGKTPLIGR